MCETCSASISTSALQNPAAAGPPDSDTGKRLAAAGHSSAIRYAATNPAATVIGSPRYPRCPRYGSTTRNRDSRAAPEAA